MLKRVLLALASNHWLKAFVTHFPLARKVARRFVAGETLNDAIEVVRILQGMGLEVTLDYLGENVASSEDAQKAVKEYLRILDTVYEGGYKLNISLKLTQLGLDLGLEPCLKNLTTILDKARQTGIFVRIDMEGSQYTQATLDIFEQARKQYDNVGIVIQAYLHRSKEDIKRVNQLKGQVRLCKGAYAEPPEIAYQDRNEIKAHFIELMYELFDAGTYPAIASHDEEMIQAAIDYVNRHRVLRNEFEFQMLYGIRRERQMELLREGYIVRIYVPFGEEWYPYFMRRLAERPANLIFFLTALFRG